MIMVKTIELGVVAKACNPSTKAEVQGFEANHVC